MSGGTADPMHASNFASKGPDEESADTDPAAMVANRPPSASENEATATPDNTSTASTEREAAKPVSLATESIQPNRYAYVPGTPVADSFSGASKADSSSITAPVSTFANSCTEGPRKSVMGVGMTDAVRRDEKRDSTVNGSVSGVPQDTAVTFNLAGTILTTKPEQAAPGANCANSNAGLSAQHLAAGKPVGTSKPVNQSSSQRERGDWQSFAPSLSKTQSMAVEPHTQKHSSEIAKEAGSESFATAITKEIPSAVAVTPSAALAGIAATDQTHKSPHTAITGIPNQTNGDAQRAQGQMVSTGELQLKSNSTELKVSVQLPELGKVEVRAVTAHDVTTAHVTTTRHEALQTLSSERGTLEQALRSKDVTLASWSSQSGTSHGQSGDATERGWQKPCTSPTQSGTSTAQADNSASTEDTAHLLPDYAVLNVRV
jgi:hypothetical protein